MNIREHTSGGGEAIGMVIGDLALSVSHDKSGDVEPLHFGPNSPLVPPAVILGALSGQRPSVDLAEPIDIRGTGLDWPLAAQVRADLGTARFPAAIAWALCDHSAPEPWQWQVANRTGTCKPIDAIAEITDAALRMANRSPEKNWVTIAVPNTLEAEAQDALLASLRVRRVSAHLLWRPVAAALAWLRRYGERFETREPALNIPLGTIWAVHFSLDAFEITPLELHQRERDGRRFLLPARRLPRLKTLFGLGLAAAELLASNATSSYDTTGGAAWNLLWCTSWLRDVLHKLAGQSSDQPTPTNAYGLHPGSPSEEQLSAFGRTLNLFLSLDTVANPRMRSSRLSELRSAWGALEGPFLQPELATTPEEITLGRWVAEMRDVAAGLEPPVGMVATGSFAQLPTPHGPLARAVIRQLVRQWADDLPVLLEKPGEAGAVIAEGCAICSARLREKLPTYLDTLPQLESLVVRRGEPVWQDILGAQNRYVFGGEPWQYDPPELGLHIPIDEQQLRLSVWREGHETVREVSVAFPKSAQKAVPVSLSIKMTPGQGNARIEVIPEASELFGGKRAYLDWRRAEDTKKTKQQMLDEEPRTNPPLEPRGASLSVWRGARAALGAFLPKAERLSPPRLAYELKVLRQLLWRTDAEEKCKTPPNHFTAVSSDGCLYAGAPDSSQFTRLKSFLDQRLGAGRIDDAFPEVVRTLSYCSANTPNFMKLVHDALKTRHPVSDFHLVAIGNCLRDPVRIGQFAKKTVDCIGAGSLPERNEWLKSLARLLQYREHAAEHMDSRVCHEITYFCLQVLVEQIRAGRAAHLYRHASLCIVYLLRRRRYDPLYLQPDQPLAKDAKALFSSAIRKLRTSEPMGGIVNLPLLMKMMIDYIDLCGRGRLVGLDVGD